MSTSDQYKRQVMNDLAQGNVESMPESSAQEYDNFDDFAQRSSREERRQLFGRSLHPDSIPPSQMEPELRKAISQIKPNERDDVAREFFKQLKKRGLSERDLEQQLGLSSHHLNRMSADDVAKLAAFTYHSHPDIFQDVLADQPSLMKFLSNPLVAAIVGVVAAKWFSSHRK
jgi:AraC-like DNA-binding protein